MVSSLQGFFQFYNAVMAEFDAVSAVYADNRLTQSVIPKNSADGAGFNTAFTAYTFMGLKNYSSNLPDF
jgi:hypothetical protein